MAKELTIQLSLVRDKTRDIRLDCIKALNEIGVFVSEDIKLDEIADIIRGIKVGGEEHPYNFFFDFFIDSVGIPKTPKRGREGSGLPFNPVYDFIQEKIPSIFFLDFSKYTHLKDNSINVFKACGVPWGNLKSSPDGNFNESLLKLFDFNIKQISDVLDYAEEIVNPPESI